jgi:hypothetical protein
MRNAVRAENRESSPARARVRIARRFTDIARERREDLLIYHALARFGRGPPSAICRSPCCATSRSSSALQQLKLPFLALASNSEIVCQIESELIQIEANHLPLR